MLDVLSYLGGIANRKQASDQFTASEAQNQSQFEASKAQSQAQFETQQKLARDDFNAKLQQFADQLGLSREQQAEKIRQFNAEQARQTAEFSKNLTIKNKELDQSSSQFSQTLEAKKRADAADALKAMMSGTLMGSTARGDILSQLGSLYRFGSQGSPTGVSPTTPALIPSGVTGGGFANWLNQHR